ncbi:MAG: diguanylate cyclase [Atribacterota bacterium]|jgi:diguanylate cyclase (GGDEF)-like protein/PAS domain S-box-containing protein|nr:diguanylate cyclase [Atribacterota bacterium]MDD4288647.1 diguanylate cyclase [Atribacterota bacterium]
MHNNILQDDYLIIVDKEGRIQQIIGMEDSATGKLVGSMLSTMVIPAYFQNIMNFLLSIKNKKIEIGWEFCLQGKNNNILALFSGIQLEKDRALIIVQHPFTGLNKLLPEEAKIDIKVWQKLLHNYYRKKQITLTTKDEKRQDEFYQQYSELNNELVNLQRQMVKKNKEIEVEKERFRVTLTGIADAVISADGDFEINLVNKAALSLLMKEEEQVIKKNFWEIFKLKDKDGNNIDSIRKKLFKVGNYQGEDFDLLLNKKTAISIDFRLSLIDRNKLKTGIVLIFRDISERKKKEEQLSHFATTDILTGVYNRRMGMELLGKEIKITKRRNSLLSICFLDLDGLKKVNDEHGHQEGDKLLKKVALVIKNNIRESDIFCRMGGDEFLVIFPDSSEEAAEGIWQRILTDFQKMNRSQKCKYPMHVSHGIVEYHKGCFEEGKEIDELIELVDKRMYKEKQQHKKGSV